MAWAMVEGESEPRARPMELEWATELRDLCLDDNVAFFYKQWGGTRPKSGGIVLEGLNGVNSQLILCLNEWQEPQHEQIR